MRLLRFLAILGIVLIFGLAFAHVAELPGKLRLSGPDWLKVQHNLYIGFGPFAVVVEPLTIGLAWGLVLTLWRQRMRFGPEFAAALCVTIGLIVWALVVSPVNGALDGWTAATLPPDWAAWRNRWEIGHAIHAALFFAAFCLTFWGGREPRSAGGR